MLLLALLSCNLPADGPADPGGTPHLAQALAPTVRRVAAARDLGPGQPIALDALELAPAPDWLEDGVFDDPAELVGRVPREPILAGEVVREERLTDPEAGTDWTAVVPRGMAALPVSLTAVGALEVYSYASLFPMDPGAEAPVLEAVAVEAVSFAEHQALLFVTPEQALELPTTSRFLPLLFNPMDVTFIESNDVSHRNDFRWKPGNVAVATRALYPGIPIGPDDVVGVAPWSTAPMPAVEEVIGRVPHERILGGEPIRTERLADRSVGRGLHAMIPRSYRAVPVPLTPAARSWMSPGAFADVIGVGEQGQTHIVTKAYVLGVVDVEPPEAWLALPREEALEVSRALARGPVQLALRNELDVDVEARVPASLLPVPLGSDGVGATPAPPYREGELKIIGIPPESYRKSQ